MNSFDGNIDLSLLKDQIYKSLKMQIIMGKLEPGSRISTLEIANSMNVSCAPVREAVNMLSKDGLIMMNPRKQPVVKDISLDEEEMITELRIMIEPYAARKSVHNVTTEKINKAELLIEEITKDPTNFEKYIESDLKVHQLIYDNTGFSILKEVLNMLQDHSLRMRYLPEEKSKYKEEIMTVSTKEHQEILDALRNGNEDLVEKAVYKHMKKSQGRFVEKK